MMGKYNSEINDLQSVTFCNRIYFMHRLQIRISTKTQFVIIIYFIILVKL